MSDTPRTDAKRGFHDLDTAIAAEFSEQLERELNAANERIRHLEQENDALKADLMLWTEAKEDKP